MGKKSKKVKIDYICPNCQQENLYQEIFSPSQEKMGKNSWIACQHCHTELALQGIESLQNEGILQKCLICGDTNLYVQRDFNRILGCLIIAISIALAYHTRGISLALAVVADFLLYHFLPEITICYRCSAVYREVLKNPAHQSFDPKIGEQ